MVEKESKESYCKLNLYLGTYSGSIFSLSVDTKGKKLEKSSFKSCDNVIKTIVPYEDEYLFSSGNDEIIRIYNIKNMEEKGIVVSYSGTITHMLIAKKNIFAICDNKIEIFRMKDFVKINTLEAHKHPVNSILLHSTGKILFSVARDNYLMMWNLVNYKCSFRYKFSGLEILTCHFILKEKYIVLGFPNRIMVLDYTKDSDVFEEWVVFEHKVETSFDDPSKIVEVKILKDNTIVVFKSNFDLELIKVTLDEKTSKTKFDAATCQIDAKNVRSNKEDKESTNIRLKFAEISSKKYSFFIIVSSNNEINIYDATKICKSLFETKSEKQVFTTYKHINVLADRFTCLSVRQQVSNN